MKHSLPPCQETCEGKQTDLILLDFSKTFDKVNHSTLRWKLHLYMESEDMHLPRSLPSWVTGRIRWSLMERNQNSPCDFFFFLGPNLFLIYINDLPDELSSPSRSRSRKDVVFTGMPVLIILHYGIVCFPFGKFLHRMWVPMFECTRDVQFCIKF